MFHQLHAQENRSCIRTLSSTSTLLARSSLSINSSPLVVEEISSLALTSKYRNHHRSTNEYRPSRLRIVSRVTAIPRLVNTVNRTPSGTVVRYLQQVFHSLTPPTTTPGRS